MDTESRETLVEALNILRSMIDLHGDEVIKEIEVHIVSNNMAEAAMKPQLQDANVFEEAKEGAARSNGRAVPVLQEEKRIDSDLMDDPPFSEAILSDLGETCIDLSAMEMQRGKPMECVVIGDFTAAYAIAMSNSFGGSGGRVLCIGDCLDQSGSLKESWASAVGDRLGKTIFPVKGDTTENYQGLEKMLDIVLFSTCGMYHETASLISKWAGLVRSGGIVCGTQWDEDNYPASVSAIKEIFGSRAAKRSDSGFWYVQSGVSQYEN